MDRPARPGAHEALTKRSGTSAAHTDDEVILVAASWNVAEHNPVTPEERLRAGGAVAQRIADQSMSFGAVTDAAGIDPKTLRSLITGARWPTAAVQAAIEAAIDWHPGEIMRRARAPYVSHSPLSDYTNTELLAELLHRSTEADQDRRIRVTDRSGLDTSH
ncbi:MAG: hypothetical protein QOG80_2285 [Pseudonocardiales bacterium]|jgi:hypothetical protein|nr:hypothetical protein [Pseudonocardiales bacterium]